MAFSFFTHKQKKQPQLSKILIKGSKFLKWNENSSLNVPDGVDLRVDEDSFIIYWIDLKKKSDYLEISLIRDVRVGKYANIPRDRNLRQVLSSGQSNIPIQEKTISIFYGNELHNTQCLNFVSLAPNPDHVANEWAKNLNECSTNLSTQNPSPWDQINKLRSILLYGKSVYDEKTRDFRLSVQTIIDTLLLDKNMESARQHIHLMLQSSGLPYDKNDSMDEKILTKEKFQQFFIRLVPIAEVETIFNEYGSRKKLSMNAEQFEKFINEKQRDVRLNELLYPYLTVKQSAEIIHKFEIDEAFKKKKQLSPQGLLRYLMDAENEAIDPIKYGVYDDMNQPLCHYFINSSHNTYLAGHQITGESQAEMYRQVLLSGCRCIELDCWDDKNLLEPIITHGHTLCTQILFKDAIEAIKESAFKTSPYPVLLSFENHCSKVMQAKMARYCVDIFGDALLANPLSENPLEPNTILPSPESLKYKILIKNSKKKLKETITKKRSFEIPQHESFNSELRSIKMKSADQNAQSTTLTVGKQLSVVSNLSQYAESDTDTDDESSCVMDNISELEMSQLVVYLQPVKFKSFEEKEETNKSFEMSSFTESRAYNLLKERPIDFVNYNKKFISRIYPKGSRIASDNYMPQLFWNVGCQMVALNFQTLDTPMQLNLGKFAYNNRSGYLLKPEAMRRIGVNQSFDPFSELPITNIVAQTATVKVINGIFLSDKRKPAYVTVELYGLPVDTFKGTRAFRAKVVSSNLCNAVFNDITFRFRKIIMPQLALLRFVAYDEQNKFIGHSVLPISDIRSGYKFISLRSEANIPLNMCIIFVDVSIKNYIPEEFLDFSSALENPTSYISSLEQPEPSFNDLMETLEYKRKFGTGLEKYEAMLKLLTEEEDEITHL